MASTGRRPGVQVLYVAGIPRTGSTVLGQALANLDDVTFVGELNFFWRRFANSELCSCGAPLPDCPFWSQVVDKALGEGAVRLAPGIADLERRVMRRRGVLSILPIGSRVWMTQHVRKILTLRAELYRAIGEVTGADWVLDAGKEPVYGSLIARIENCTLNTIHLVRDPRGVAYSWTKRVRSDSEPRDMPRRGPLATSASWLVQNLVIQFGLQRLSSSYIRVRYEDLASGLAEVVNVIAANAGADPLPAGSTAILGKPGDIHLVAGNPGVRRAGTVSRMSLDEEWRTSLSASQQRLVTAICAILMIPYGYRVLGLGSAKRDRGDV